VNLRQTGSTWFFAFTGRFKRGKVAGDFYTVFERVKVRAQFSAEVFVIADDIKQVC